jgi:type I restriction enzyme S subunit
MAAEWRRTTLGQVIRLQRGHDLPEGQRRPGKVPILGSFGITGWHDEARAKGPGLTVGRSGASMGVVAFSSIDYWPLNTCLFVTDFLGNDPRFCYYWLRSLDFSLFNSGSAQPSLNRNYIYDLPVQIPGKPEQVAIAQTLEVLDKSIFMLQSKNDMMEAIARAIFKSWFVDFDPVRAKAEGREPEGMDADTAALFPSTFDDSELGPIPQGWTTGPITNVLSLNPTRSLKKRVTATYLDMASVPTSGPRATSWIKRDFVSGSKFINGDTLLARITPCLENGKTAYVDFLEQDEVGWGSTEFIVMATKPNVPSQFVYLLARDPEFRQYAIQSMSGTSGRQRVQVDQLAMFKIAIANDSIYRAFGTLIERLFQRIRYSSEEQTTLTDLRDTLLPRLISGKLRVPEAEAMLMAV